MVNSEGVKAYSHGADRQFGDSLSPKSGWMKAFLKLDSKENQYYLTTII